MGFISRIARVLVVVCVFGLAGCGASSPEEVPTRPTETGVAEAAPTVKPTTTLALSRPNTGGGASRPASYEPTPTPIPAVQPPAWLDEAAFYLVFVRSFADGNGDGIGDLQGLTAQLDYLNDGNPETTDDLGVNVLWMMPIFEATTYHGYDTVDYYTVNPEYGTNEDLATLIEEAHKRGMRVVIDYVIGHTSNAHPFFRDAFGNPDSQYSDWYSWLDEGHTKYKSFFGVENLPSLNTLNPEVQAYLLEVATYWLDPNQDGDPSDGVDGLRADYALGVSHEMWKLLRDEVKAVNPDALLLGEVWEGSPERIAPFYDDEFDATFGFPYYLMLMGSHDANGDGVINGEQRPALLHGALFRMEQVYPWGATSVNFINNHDTNRVMSDVLENERRAKLAAASLMTVPGVPLLYYGEEIGMRGVKGKGDPYWDEYRREPMDWYANLEGPVMTTWFAPADAQNKAGDGVSVEEGRAQEGSLWRYYRDLLGLRAAHSELRSGSLERVGTSNPYVYAYLRQNADGAILIVQNFSRAPSTVTLDFGKTTLPQGRYAPGDLLGSAKALEPFEGDEWQVEVGAEDTLMLDMQP